MKNVILILSGFIAGIVSTNIFNSYADVENIEDEWVPSKDPAPARSYIY